ncbi:acyl-CoA synthetases/AMP-acid ligases II [Lophiostoma macrostomum CBS 122681]|uniref:Acyl-CoA synthetases/AMP-acid ligases II n=1 Tax=Lophiostoma macrostomum CBS 122681 TaxID=1314788 RepID=A0A6A6SUH4_9PLEO|nr:acyl-CoA synthetases/AMP-acid ligases II [Lophiostoma macrostomum CBS 122681]
MASQRIHRSHYPPTQIPTNISVSQLLQLYNPDDVAGDKVVCEDDWTGKSLSYAGIREDAAKGAFALKHIVGLQEGDSICISSPNSVAVVKLIHAVLWCGGIAVLINPLSTEYEVAHCLDVARPKFLASDASTRPTLHSAAKRQGLPHLTSISVDDISGDFSSQHTLSSLFSHQELIPPFDLSERDSREHTAVVCFSSGTSGKAKGVELSHYNVVASMLGMRATDPTYWNANIRSVFLAPLCHIYGLMTVALMGAWIGAYNVLMRKYTLESFLELSASINANAFRILPTIAVAISKQASFDLARLSSVKLIMCTGAALPPSTIKFFQEAFAGAPIFQGYGMTEANITMLKAESAHHIGSVGKLFANVEARIIDDEGNGVTPGEQGEICIRGPNVFRRYMRNAEATNDTFVGNWMKTGDVGKVDKEGYFFLTERKKELIKYKGNQVAPAELEALLNSHPDVSEGAVCALWDSDQGTEVPIAYISLRKGVSSSAPLLASIRQHVDSEVAPYKKLRGGIVVLDEIPKSGNGKILRRMLPARLARERNAKL